MIAGAHFTLPDTLLTAKATPMEAHLVMQATLEAFVDNSISKTINVSAATTLAESASIYRSAYDRGLKGCTASRPMAARGSVLTRTSLPGSEYSDLGEQNLRSNPTARSQH